eukprot:s576_g13.t1
MPLAPLQGPMRRIGCSAGQAAFLAAKDCPFPGGGTSSRYTEVPNVRRWHEKVRTLHCTEIKVATTNERHSELYYNMKRLAMRSEENHLEQSFPITSTPIPVGSVDIRGRIEARAHSKTCPILCKLRCTVEPRD